MALDSLLSWHADAWSQVMSQQRHQRLAHAYLVSGLAGSGRKQFARTLAARLLCERPATESLQTTACGQCRPCHLVAAGNHPDLHDISPEEGRSSIKIDQIRAISRVVNQTSNQTGAIKVIIIQPAEALGLAAANALLKNLEEPPGKTLFLLISGPSVATMLPTIRSRCQPLPLPPAPVEQALAWLAKHSAAANVELSAALVLSPGAPMQALALLEEGIPAWHKLVHEQLAGMAAGRVSPLELAKYCNAQPPNYAIQLMQALSLQKTQEALASQNTKKAKAFLQFGRELIRINKLLGSGANPNSLMALETIFSTWQDATGDKDVTDTRAGLQFLATNR